MYLVGQGSTRKVVIGAQQWEARIEAVPSPNSTAGEVGPQVAPWCVPCAWKVGHTAPNFIRGDLGLDNPF